MPRWDFSMIALSKNCIQTIKEGDTGTKRYRPCVLYFDKVIVLLQFNAVKQFVIGCPESVQTIAIKENIITIIVHSNVVVSHSIA